MTRGRIAKPEVRFVRRAIRAPRELWAQLDAVVPPRGRSKFIREAIEAALARQTAPQQQPPEQPRSG